ncbi:glycosyltransferase family 4 protein [Spongisporangium articulatum]|uniref:Glycosyltransferase family 4 protein n=1 Tax=Spongisporangium articulatum TaxID=3362603 RepID=A0ABW8AQP4_9ACTN
MATPSGGVLGRLGRLLRRQARALPRRTRTARALAVSVAQGEAASLLARRSGEERALELLAAATLRSPHDLALARSRAQLLNRTGRLSEAVAEASRLAVAGPKPGNRRMQRSLQGRLVETDPGWLPAVPGSFDGGAPEPGRVLYLAKESMPHRNNGYCTRTHETLLAVRAAGRDPVAVTLPGFGSGASSVVDGIEYRHVMPGAADLFGALTAEEFVQLTTTAFARQLLALRPAVLHAGSGHRGFDLALPGLALARWAGLPWIYEVRSFFETTWTKDARYAEGSEYYHRRFAAETRAMRAADLVVTLSGPMRDEIVHGHGVRESSVVVVPNAVDLDRFVPVPAAGRDPRLAGGFVLGYVSNLDHHREGQEVLLDAAARLRASGHDVRVLLVGDGRRRAELEARARALGLGSATVFTGSVPFDEVPGWYAQIDLFVVPRVPERAARMVSPMKPFEAMAMRVPVLLSDLPALVEIAGDDEERAFVFPASSAEGLAAKVAALMAAPEALAARVDRAEAWVRAERTWAANGKAFDRVYAQAADRAAERLSGVGDSC